MPELCRKLARVYQSQGDYETTLSWVERGLEAAGATWEAGAESPAALPEEFDAASAARLSVEAGLAHWRQGHPAEAALWAHRARALAESAGPSALQDLAQSLNLLGILARQEGRAAESESFCRRSLAGYEALGDVAGADKAHTNLGCALQDQGDLAGALEHLRRSQELARRLGDPMRQATAEANMGEIHILMGDLEKARQCYDAALPSLERVGHRYGAATCRMNLAWLHLGLGDGPTALAWADAAREAFEGIGAAHHLPEALRHRAHALLVMGRSEEARTEAEESLRRARELEQRIEEGQALRVLGQVLAAAGDVEGALGRFEAGEALLEEVDARHQLGLTLLEHARLLAGVGGWGIGVGELCERAADLFRATGAARDLAAAEALGESLRAGRRPDSP